MTVEAAGYIDDIDPTQPLGTDAKSEGDDHLRNLKKSVQDSLPNISGAMTVTHTDLNGFFATGNLMLFQQSAAPTGWTKEATHDNKALRVVTGTASSGGSVAFTTAFASKSVSGSIGGTALSVAQMASHSHTQTALVGGRNFTGSASRISDGDPAGSFGALSSTNSTGSGSTHTHSFSGTAINMAVQYVDLIIASKD